MKLRILALFVVLSHTAGVQAGAIRNLPGFATTVYGGNDDGSYPCTGQDSSVPPDCAPTTVPIGFTIKFFGESFSNLYVNNNGNITFSAPLEVFSPFGLVDSESKIIAPFFADVDTRDGDVVTFGNDIVDGHQAFGVDWINIGYFDTQTDKLNSFEVVLIDRSDRKPGDFDIEFNYDQIQWETGDASGGEDGLGGDSAVVGFSNGSGQPGTSFELRGSEVPGELLDSNPGGLIHGFLNTNVPGRYVFPIVSLPDTNLEVELFSQGDSRWATNAYAGSTHTIQQEGCALACLAMALEHAGVPTDPGILNTLMINDKDFVGTSVNWDPATRDASGGSLEFHGYRTSDTFYLNEELESGYPVIVGVNLNKDGAPGHFVLVVGQENGQYLINDPGHSDATTLDYYNNEFETRGYVGDPRGNVGGFDMGADNGGDILVVDPLGRRTGYDPAIGVVLEEIPQSVHFLDCIEDNDLTGAPGTNSAHVVNIYQPLQGTYQIYLFDQVSGGYQMNLRSFSQSGASGTPLVFQSTAKSNTIETFQISLGAINTVWQPFTNECPWSVFPTNGLLPMTAQFTGPDVDSEGITITTWRWIFGDGTTDTQQSPSHVYSSGGVYFPELEAINDAGDTCVAFGASVTFPTIQFTAIPAFGQPPFAVQFNVTNKDSEGYTLTSFGWSFGDGSTGSGQNPSHTYETTGIFAPTVASTNALGEAVSGVGPWIRAVTGLTNLGLVLNGGFETGDFTCWTLSGDTNFVFVDDGSGFGITPCSENYSATLGTYYSTCHLSQSLPTVPGASYLLSFWLENPFADPVELNVSWNGNTILDTTNLDNLNWTNVQFAVAATGASTMLQFGFQDYQYCFGLDAVSVTPAQPGIVGINPSGANLVLNASNGVSGWTYYVLMTTNLALPLSHWTPVATNVLGASGNFAITVTNTLSLGAPQRFCALQLQLQEVGAPPAPPGIGSFSLSGADLALNVSDGVSGRTYYVLMGTNLAAPLSQWTRVATNVLDTGGNFTMTVTNTVSHSVPQRFYILQSQ